MHITMTLDTVETFAREAGFEARPFGPGWGYSRTGRWTGRQYTRAGREITALAGADDAVTGGTVRLVGGTAALLSPAEITGALLTDWSPVSLVKSYV